MSKKCENIYKTSRTTAGMTQEQASEALNVAPRTLSDYENGHTRVPDDIVAAMTEAYNQPLLAYFHLKKYSPLGKYLPDVQDPQSNGDMAFQAIIAREELEPAVDSLKQIVADGTIESDEKEEFGNAINTVRKVNGKLFSVVAYADKIGKKGEKE